MKCVTLVQKPEPRNVDEIQDLDIKPAKLFIEEYVADVERERTCSQLLRSLQGVHSAEDFDRLTETVKDKIATLGTEELIYCPQNSGFFQTLLMAYENQWSLRTSPDDWWFSVVRRITLAVAQNSRKHSVRQLLARPQGKRTLEIMIPSDNIFDTDHGLFFNEISNKISENIDMPEYVDAVMQDFTQTTGAKRLVSQIALMTSQQEFYTHEHKSMTSRGIPVVEMRGCLEDWAKLRTKLKTLRKFLKPVKNDIGLAPGWWAHVDKVFKKLLATYTGKPDKDWWSRIISQKPPKSGQTKPSGGWATYFFAGEKSSDGKDNFPTGLVSVPVTILCPPGEQEEASLAAGIVGFTLRQASENAIPAVEAVKGWTLLLEEDSPFRC